MRKSNWALAVVLAGGVGCASGEATGPDAGLGSIFADAGRGSPGDPPDEPKTPADASVPAQVADAAVLPPPPPAPDAAPGCTDQQVQLLANANFDQGAVSWSETSTGGYTIISAMSGAHSGTHAAWLGGYDAGSDILQQDVSIPAGAENLAVSGYFAVVTDEDFLFEWDVAALELRTTTGALLETLATWSNTDDTFDTWMSFSVVPQGDYQGQTVRLYLRSQTDNSLPTSFVFDTLALRATVCQ